ncbi:GntR family transcriptional regulator [Arcanobacterium phocae]|uniref:GntR family transcriptional regulator n=1 Tax=Arcanobacterium phocae TaxID=131112 RepID=UPI001C0EC439|nr:GntR family transcriptional regulator [Arcanobacterium phocae]
MSVDVSRPIWIQLVETFSRNIVTGEWTAGSKIPSVRELALTTGVNPNTIQRALSQLDASGLTVAERTQGRFVTTDRALINDTQQDLASQATDAHIDAVSALGLSLDETVALIRERWASSSS